MKKRFRSTRVFLMFLILSFLFAFPALAIGPLTTSAHVATWDREADPSVANYYVYWRKQVTASSTSSVPMMAGNQTFATQAGLPFVVGNRLMLNTVAGPAQPVTYMEGTVTAYSGASLTVSVDKVYGSAATFAAWTITYDWVNTQRSPVIPQPAVGVIPTYDLSGLNLPTGTYEICATALDAAGNESGPSNSAPFPWSLPASPSNLRLPSQQRSISPR